MSKDDAKVTAIVKWKVNKYDGEKVDGDGKEPIEVVEGETEMPYEDYLKLQENQNAIS